MFWLLPAGITTACDWLESPVTRVLPRIVLEIGANKGTRLLQYLKANRLDIHLRDFPIILLTPRLPAKFQAFKTAKEQLRQRRKSLLLEITSRKSLMECGAKAGIDGK
jgi:hypothetical protein